MSGCEWPPLSPYLSTRIETILPIQQAQTDSRRQLSLARIEIDGPSHREQKLIRQIDGRVYALGCLFGDILHDALAQGRPSPRKQ
jgi:hypothetical protein